MVTGASGDGKSSLIFAGLIPSIKAGFFKAKFGSWKISVFRPGNDPLSNFSRSLAPHFGEEKESSIRSNLALGYSSLVDLYKHSSLFEGDILGEEKAVKGASNLLIVVDQFEEFFTNKENFNRETAMPSIEANTAVNLLIETTRIAKEEELSIYIVCTMRSDYIGNAPSFRGLPELIGKNQFFVPRLNRAEMLSAVTEPALLAGAKISQRLAQRMLNDLSSVNTDVLPVLQHAVRRVWHMAEGGGQELDLWHYCAVGGMESKDLPEGQRANFETWFESLPQSRKVFYQGQKKSYAQDLSNVLNLHGNILFETAAEYYNTHGKGEISKGEAQALLNAVFKCLTKIDDSRAVRNRITLEEIAAIIDRPGCGTTKLGRLIDIYRDQGSTLIYPFIEEGKRTPLEADTLLDITHEALIRNWKKLSKWTKEEYDSANVFREMSAQLGRWVKGGKSSTYLLTSGPYEYYHKWYSRQGPSAAWLSQYVDTEIYKTDGITLSPLVERETEEPEDQSSAAQLSLNLAEFLVDSEANINRSKKIRQTIVAVISVLLVVAVGALVWAVSKKNQATSLQQSIAATSRANEIATAAYLQLESNPTLAFRMAEQALQIKSTPLARQLLLASYAKVPFYNELIGHSAGGGGAPKFSPDGKYVLTTSDDNTVRLWNYKGDELLQINHHKPLLVGVQSDVVNFSPDSRLFSIAAGDSVVSIWNIQGSLIDTLKMAGSVIAAYFLPINQGLSPDENSEYSILCYSSYGEAILWKIRFKGDIDNEPKVHTTSLLRRDNEAITGLDFSSDGKRILTMTDEGSINVWDSRGVHILEIPSAQEDLTDACFSPNNEQIITCGSTGGNIWNSRGKKVTSFAGKGGVTVSGDGRYICTNNRDNNAYIYDKNGQYLATLKGHTAMIWSFQFNPVDPKIIATSANDNTARIWNIDGRELMVLNGHNSQVLHANFSGDGQYIVTSSSYKNGLIWNLNVKENPVLGNHTHYVHDADISEDGKFLLTADWHGKTILWNNLGYELEQLSDDGISVVYTTKFVPFDELILSTHNKSYLFDFAGNLQGALAEYSGRTEHVQFNRKYKLILTESFVKSNSVIWDHFGNKIDDIPDVQGSTFSNDGSYLLTLSTKHNIATLLEINPSSKNLVKAAKGREDSLRFVSSVELKGHTGKLISGRISPNSNLIVTSSADSSVRIWNMAGVELARLKVDSATPGVVQISSDGKRILVIYSNAARLLTLSGEIPSNLGSPPTAGGLTLSSVLLRGHSDIIRDAKFSPDSKYVVTGSNDKTVRVWNLKGEEVQRLTSHTALIHSVDFSPDGKYILSSSNDLTARYMPWRVEDVLNKINVEKVRGEVWELSEADKKVYGIID